MAVGEAPRADCCRCRGLPGVPRVGQEPPLGYPNAPSPGALENTQGWGASPKYDDGTGRVGVVWSNGGVGIGSGARPGPRRGCSGLAGTPEHQHNGDRNQGMGDEPNEHRLHGLSPGVQWIVPQGRHRDCSGDAGWLNFGTIRPIRQGLQAPIEIKSGPTHTKLYFALIPVKRAHLISASRGGRKMHVVRSLFAGSSIIRWWNVAHRGLQPISPKRVARPGTTFCAGVFGSFMRVTEPRRGGGTGFRGKVGRVCAGVRALRAYTRERAHRRRAHPHTRALF